jgi:hypothetical protein
MKSIFLKKMGSSTRNKIMDFLITFSDFDYSLKEISKNSNTGYSTVKIIIKKMLEDDWLILTRKISKIKLYKLNRDNIEVEKFIDFYWAVIENELQKSPEFKEKYKKTNLIKIKSKKNLKNTITV